MTFLFSTFGLFTISLRKRSSAKERLREISRVVKTSALAINASASMYFRANALMCTVMPLKLIELVASMQAIFPVYITNVPGPNQEMNLLDNDTRIVDILATLGHPVSYMGASFMRKTYPVRTLMREHYSIFCNV